MVILSLRSPLEARAKRRKGINMSQIENVLEGLKTPNLMHDILTESTSSQIDILSLKKEAVEEIRICLAFFLIFIMMN